MRFYEQFCGFHVLKTVGKCTSLHPFRYGWFLSRAIMAFVARYIFPLLQMRGSFHSIKTSGLNFRQLPVANGTAFSKISWKGDNLAWVYPNFLKFFPRSFLSAFNFAPGISRVFGWMVRISEIQQLSKFLETLLGNFCTICHCFQIFESFVWMESARNFKQSLFLSTHVLARGLAQTQNFSWAERTLNGSSSELFLVMRQHGSEK